MRMAKLLTEREDYFWSGGGGSDPSHVAADQKRKAMENGDIPWEWHALTPPIGDRS
jgi:hypothetical protein